MPADKSISALFHLTPKEAADYLKGREKITPTFNHLDLFNEEHTTQFTVSRLARVDILQSMYDGIKKSVNGDMSRQDWMRNARLLLKKEGWWGEKEVLDPKTGKTVTTTFDPARLSLIYDTNTRIAYSAGLWQRMQRNKGTLPYARYISMHDKRVRPLHAAWDGTTLSLDDPWWDTHYPPNGYRCRCRVMSMTQAEYDGDVTPDGAPLKKTAPPIEYRDYLNKRIGVIERVPKGIDPGFGYNPGKAALRQKNLAQLAQGKMQALPAPIRKAALDAQVVGNVDANFKAAIDTALDTIPEPVRVLVFSAGYEVRVGPTLIDIHPELAGKHPPGFPPDFTWAHADGVRLAAAGIIAIGQTCLNPDTGKLFKVNPAHSARVLRHEFAHAVDDILHVSVNNNFIQAYEQDLQAIDINRFPDDDHEHIRYMMQPGQRGRRETFAEIFSAFYGGGSAAIKVKELFPKASRAVKLIMKESGY